jgi:hypothetical protein
MTDDLEAMIIRHLNGDTSDPLRDALMRGLNPQQDEQDEQDTRATPIALNDDAALTAKILNS